MQGVKGLNGGRGVGEFVILIDSNHSGGCDSKLRQIVVLARKKVVRRSAGVVTSGGAAAATAAAASAAGARAASAAATAEYAASLRGRGGWEMPPLLVPSMGLGGAPAAVMSLGHGATTTTAAAGAVSTTVAAATATATATASAHSLVTRSRWRDQVNAYFHGPREAGDARARGELRARAINQGRAKQSKAKQNKTKQN